MATACTRAASQRREEAASDAKERKNRQNLLSRWRAKVQSGETFVLLLLLPLFTEASELHIRVDSDLLERLNTPSSDGIHSTKIGLEQLTVATLDEAGRIVAEHLQLSSRDITIHLAAGSHRVPVGGLQLGPQHSPSNPRHTVRWVGAANGSALSGGEPVTGWQLAQDLGLPHGTMVAPAPILLNGLARHLFVNGARAQRSRHNATLALPGLHLEARPDCPACSYSTSSNVSWANAEDVEFVYSGVGSSWSEIRCTVANVTLTEGRTRISMKQPCLWNAVNRNAQPIHGSPPVWIENAKEYIANPGEWYHDRSSKQIFYVPLVGQDMATAKVALAVEETLVSHVGLSRHSWSNVTFEHATFLRPMKGEGFVDQQAGACDQCKYGVPVPSEGCGMNDDYVTSPGNVVIFGSHRLEFVGCTFRHLGAYAASATGASQHIAWRGCTFSDISAGALMLGNTSSWACNGGASDYHGRGSIVPNKTCTPGSIDATQIDSHFIVEDCKLLNIPVEFSATTAIFASYVSDTIIQHNHIANTTYSAITLGWGWGREAGGVSNNQVVGNKIESILSERCCDGGAVYTLGPQPNSSIRANHLVQPFRTDWASQRQSCLYASADETVELPPHPAGNGNYSGCAGKGIYHDNGSGGFTDTENVIDGAFNRFITGNNPMGPYGPGVIETHLKNGSTVKSQRLCPGVDGEQHDCTNSAVTNYIRMVVPKGSGYSGVATHDNWMNGIWVPRWPNHNDSVPNPPSTGGGPPTFPFPPAAQAIIAAAGPRPTAPRAVQMPEV